MATITRAVARPAEAADYIGVSPKTLRNWRSLKRGPKYVGRGHGVRYPYRELEAWLKANTHQ